MYTARANNVSLRYGKRCRYAHGQEELRPISRSNQYKTKTCKAYHEHGTCSYGIRCTFIHHPSSADAAKNDLIQPCSPSSASSTTTMGSSPHALIQADQNEKELDVAPDHYVFSFISSNVWESMLGLSSYEPQQINKENI